MAFTAKNGRRISIPTLRKWYKEVETGKRSKFAIERDELGITSSRGKALLVFRQRAWYRRGYPPPLIRLAAGVSRRQSIILQKVGIVTTLALAVMAKNEEAVIGRLIESVAGVVDKVLLSDTGSDDETIAAAAETCAKYGIPLEFECVEWSDFGTNRTSLMRFCEGAADYLLIGDADETFEFNDFDKNELDLDGYYLPYSGTEFYRVMLLIRNNLNWHYKCRTHEVLAGDIKSATHFNKIIVTHHKDGGSRHDKYERDLRLLQQDLDEGVEPARNTFYMAQTYEGLEDHRRAAEWYEHRSDMGGWEEERWVAQMRAAKLSLDFYGCMEAWSCRPVRMEPLYYASVVAAGHGDWPMVEMLTSHGLKLINSGRVNTTDVLFIEKWIYDIGMLAMFVVASKKMNLECNAEVNAVKLKWAESENYLENVAKHFGIEF